MTKLTNHDVKLIRLLYAAFPGLKQRGIGKLFGVQHTTVSMIVNRKRHRYLA
jgi:hypothetical protein